MTTMANNGPSPVWGGLGVGGDDNTDPGEIHDDLEGAPGDGRAGIEPEQCGVKNRGLNDAADIGAQTPAICVPPKVKTSPTVRTKMIGNPPGKNPPSPRMF